MGNRIENPNDSRSRRLPRLLRSGLFLLITSAPLIALLPGEAHAQAGIKEVSGAELIRPTPGSFSEGPLRVYDIPSNLSGNVRSKAIDLVSGAEVIRSIDEADQSEIPGLVRSMLVAGDSIINDISPSEDGSTSGH